MLSEQIPDAGFAINGGGLKPPPTDGTVSTPWTTAACDGLRSAPDCRPRRDLPSSLAQQPIGNSARDLCRRLVGDREYRTDVDLAKHVAVDPVVARWAEHEVRVPDHRELAPGDVQQGGQLRCPLVFHQSAQALKAWIGIGGVEPASGLGARGRCVDQGLDLLLAEAGAAIACHVAAHHAFAQARLEWLIDYALVVEILGAPLQKLVQRQLLRCVLGSLQHA